MTSCFVVLTGLRLAMHVNAVGFSLPVVGQLVCMLQTVV